MKIGARTRVGITLSLGILVGVGFVILPGLFATPTTNSTSTGASVRAPIPVDSIVSSSSTSKNNQPLAPTTSVVVNLAFIVALILFPAISLSIFVRHWTLKGTKNRLESKKQ